MFKFVPLIVLSFSFVTAQLETFSYPPANYGNLDNRYHHHHHHKFYAALILHYAYGAVAILFIIKIVLGIAFLGMASVVMQMFATFKGLFESKEVKPQVVQPQVVVPQLHHSHEIEYDFPGHYPGYDYHHRRKDINNYYKKWRSYKTRQDLTGGRSLANEPYLVQEIINKERNKRNIEGLFGRTHGSRYIHRKERSVEPSKLQLHNCEKRKACVLHAKAKHGLFQTFQLYFVKKKGLARFWDHKEFHNIKDCATAYPYRRDDQEIT